MTRHVHVVGAGLAGLAAAVRLSEIPGIAVSLSEAAASPGGRCRTFHDRRLDRRIDNGNHLILSGNTAVLDHARRIGAAGRLYVLDAAEYPFVDLRDGRRWQVRIPRWPAGLAGASGLPFRPGLADLADLGRLMLAGRGTTVADAVRARGPVWTAFWEPLTVAVLNAPPQHAAAVLLRAALRGSFLRGARASRPVLAPDGLGAALVAPAVNLLRARGVAVRCRTPLEGLATERGRAIGLRFGDGRSVALAPGDGVILALAPAALGRLLPGLALPGPGSAILNAHFRVLPSVAEAVPPITGVLSAQTQWIFRRSDVLSVTVSAAEASEVWGLDRDAALGLLWREVARALGTDAAPIAARLVRERAATFDQSPEGLARRSGMRTGLANVVLAGDHVATGLPASLEGAVRSGVAAARAVGRGARLDRLKRRGGMVFRTRPA